ncbi:glycosyltransferase family 25 protein [Gulosibacter molinativorax]|nr:glycosyltransferase family 25 protein [Gulosibacter molinativorax]QUY62747.1 Hypotetical protein [Gulosibacter molinativorax]
MDRDQAHNFESLEREISTRSIESLASDTEFAGRFASTVSNYFGQSVQDLFAARRYLTVAAKYVAVMHGNVAAQGLLLEQLDRGLSGDVVAITSLQVSRRLKDYDRGSEYLREIYYRSSKSPYIGYFLGESLVSSGDLVGFRRFALSVLEDASTKKFGDREVLRWANLLADAGEASIALEFAGLATASEETVFLRERINSLLSGAHSAVPIRIINLLHEDRKWRIGSSSLTRAGYKNVQRHIAVAGSALPDALVAGIIASEVATRLLGKGATACWLSHWSVWEEIADDSSSGVGLVLEDDALPFTGAEYLDRIIEATTDFDLVWVNDRMSSIAHGEHVTWGLSLLDPWEQLRSWPGSRQGWGADAYLLTRQGAQKLLAMAEQDGIQNHVDGQVGAFSTAIRSEPLNGIQRRIETMQRGMSLPAERMKATSVNVPAFRARPFGVSSTVTVGRDS